MADEERKVSKRSRFDQTEPDVKRISRFDRDRRSRSPTSRASETQRSRSPLAPKTPFSPGADDRKTPLDPAAAAGNVSIMTGWRWKINSSLSGGRSSNKCLDTSQERHTACRCSSNSCGELTLVSETLTFSNNVSDRKPSSESVLAQPKRWFKHQQYQWRHVYCRWRLHQRH